MKALTSPLMVLAVVLVIPALAQSTAMKESKLSTAFVHSALIAVKRVGNCSADTVYDESGINYDPVFSSQCLAPIDTAGADAATANERDVITTLVAFAKAHVYNRFVILHKLRDVDAVIAKEKACSDGIESGLRTRTWARPAACLVK